MSNHALRVTVSDSPRGRSRASAGLSRWLTAIAPARAKGVVNVAIVSDRQVRDLNRQYRRKDRATDVLSFGYDPQSHEGTARAERSCLGDIVIARGVARRQARAAGHDERTEVRILALHGLLHLLGYDHHRDGGAMARRERQLRRKGGLPQGLIERSEP